MIKTTLVAFIVILLVAVFGISGYTYSVLQQPIVLASKISFVVPQGTSFMGLAQEFQQRGWVSNAKIYQWYGRLTGKAQRIKAGEYELEAGQITPIQLLEVLQEGQVKQYSLTIVEGVTFSDMFQQLQAESRLQHKIKATAADQVMHLLGHPELNPEGQFFPDTYFFTKNTSDLDLLQQAFERMQRVLQQEWQQRAQDLPYKSPYEVLIMASIVEKETGAAIERPRIAGVFVNRLQRGMRLQTDPTVIYGLGEQYQGDIKFIHLRQKTPYNTYKIKGLPPTPIALPGQAAIHATLHPQQSKELYFVAKGDGTHHFSTTLQEHNRAVRKYQKRR